MARHHRAGPRGAACLLAAVAVAPVARPALAGPETALRELASGQIKKGVRSIGMGGDGATGGNYALVTRDAGTAIADGGLVHYGDTGNDFSFTAVGFTSPTFWDGAALYVIAMAQRAADVHVFTLTPANPGRPPSIGDGSNEALFLKLARPLSEQVSVGLLLSYELSQMTLVPDNGSATIRFRTSWLPSGGAGVTWEPVPWLLAGARVILNHDHETRSTAAGSRTGLLRSYEYRAGVAVVPWSGGVVDAGLVMLDRSNGLDGTSKRRVGPNLGVEQVIVERRLWLRAGLDETTWTAGVSARHAMFRLDVAYLHDLAAARTEDVFGRSNDALFATLTFAYGLPPPAPAAPIHPASPDGAR